MGVVGNVPSDPGSRSWVGCGLDSLLVIAVVEVKRTEEIEDGSILGRKRRTEGEYHHDRTSITIEAGRDSK